MQGNPGQQRKFPGGPTVRHQCAGPQSCQMGTLTQNQTPKSEKQFSDRCAALILPQIHDTHERWSNLAGAAFHGPVLRGPGQL